MTPVFEYSNNNNNVSRLRERYENFERLRGYYQNLIYQKSYIKSKGKETETNMKVAFFLIKKESNFTEGKPD